MKPASTRPSTRSAEEGGPEPWHDRLGRRLTGISIISSGVSLLFCVVCFGAVHLLSARSASVDYLRGEAALLAARAGDVASTKNTPWGQELLAGIGGDRRVLGGCLYGAEGRLLAETTAQGCNPDPSALGVSARSFNVIIVSQPIFHGHQRVGTLALHGQLVNLATLTLYGSIVAVVLVICFALTYFLSSRLQRTVSEPVRQLADAARRVASGGDYRARVAHAGEDELGQLVDAFNEMLDQLEAHDAEIKQHAEDLEVQVNRRTKALTVANADLRREVDHRKEAEARIRYLAYYDGLTGLPNRMLFKERTRQVIGLSDRQHQKAALLFLDLDGFKAVNDTLGHGVGDQLLKQVAERLVECVRDTDCVSRPDRRETAEQLTAQASRALSMVLNTDFAQPASNDAVSRLGGDEFTVLLSNMEDANDAAVVAQRVLEALAAPFIFGDDSAFIGASIGIAVYPDDGKRLETLLMRADMAMYHAKDRGKNNYQFFTDTMNTRIARRMRIAQDMRRALREGQFRMVYQPKVDAQTRELVGVEALMRWQHPKLGSVSPAEFIAVAEENGVICELGAFALSASCRQLRAWIDAGLEPINMAVNVSSHQVRNRTFAASIAQVLSAADLDPRWLQIEITESAMLEDDEEVGAVLERIAATGTSIALDDFGTGYSPLGYLQRFPVTAVKIDKSFVGNILEDAGSRAIANAILAMARQLDLQVVAEGVETEAQAIFMAEGGCQLLQGYYFGRPASPEQIAVRIRSSARAAG